MIRFYNAQLVLRDDMDVAIADEYILRGSDIWENAKKYFKRNLTIDAAKIQLLPVVNESQEVVCYTYQDSEANRELRMLKELKDGREVLEFHDIFPEVQNVVVCGCNELAYYFVKYLESQQISVAVTGKYWGFFGYEECGNIDLDGNHKMVVYAEGNAPQTGNLYQTVIRSVSPEFECIDRIYESNVLEGRIKDAEGDLDELLRKVREKEIVILGTDAKAQDTYDFLYEQGIDICCFAELKDKQGGDIHRTLLGKYVVRAEDVVNGKEQIVFIDCSDKNSALGTENVEIFSYYGYERNEQFFLFQDYMDVPSTNLLHVLKGKKVFFAGDEHLCAMLSEYLREIEKGDIDLSYIDLSQCETMKETDILCTVNPWFDLESLNWEENPKAWHFRERLSEQEIVSYTDYFAQVRVLVEVDLYRNRNRKKYSIKKLLPKGILLGRIQYASGNVFFRGVLDGHPSILKWGYTAFNNNLLLYCIRLADKRAEDVLSVFTKIYREEFAFRLEEELNCLDRFEKSAKTMLALKKSYTSQELFVIFHIAYEEMLRGYKIVDLSQKIIYWEPHNFPREDFPFLVQWLEDEQIHGQTIFMHRDHIVWAGSAYYYYKNYGYRVFAESVVPGLAAEKMIAYDMDYQCWEEKHMRFEDIKLHPEKELRSLCGSLGIPWSDTMLQITDSGRVWEINGVRDFGLKPVFNKYEEFFSEFDRFRISLISAPYQKKYGYTYEDCLKFSRKELQEMFLKEFRFQTRLRFRREQDKIGYFLRTHQIFMQLLWKVRRHMVLNDIVPEFDEVEIGESSVKKQKKAEIADQNVLDKLLRFVRQEEHLVLYGTGRDCEGLLEHLGEEEQKKLIFSDLKAEYMEKIFHGRQVAAPRELNGKYKDYKILITSSQFYDAMRQRLEDMGVAKDRIVCNKFQLWM